MNDLHDKIEELQYEADELPNGPTKVALLEEATRLADSLNDVHLGYGTRMELIQAATFSGRPDLLIVHFAWCLAQYDKTPDEFYAHDLLWRYKWVIGNSFSFPEISRAQIASMLEDLKRRYRANGSGLSAYWQLRRDGMVSMGDRKAAHTAHVKLRKCRRDSLSDCAACQASDRCTYHVFQGHWGRAVQAAAPVIEGRLSCAEEPHGALSSVLLPLVHLGRVDEGKALQPRGYRLVSGGSQFLKQHAQQLTFVTLMGDMSLAKRMLERHLPGCQSAVAQISRFAFFQGARLFMLRLAHSGVTELKVRLPGDLPAPDAKGRSSVAALSDWFTCQASTLADRFDARDGNHYFRAQVKDLPMLLKLAVG